MDFRVGWVLPALTLVLVGALAVAARLGWLSEATVSRGAGVLVLALSGALAADGTRLRQRGDRLASLAPTALDEAISRLNGRPKLEGLFAGRLDASEEVTSPGGVVCAFYEAEVRSLEADGRKGALLAAERSQSPWVYLRGERHRAAIAFVAAEGPTKLRRCRAGGELAFALPRSLAAGPPPADAVSHERVGKLGEPCLVLGRLERGPAEGSYVVCSGLGGRPLVLLASDPREVAAKLVRRAWGRFLGALVGCLAAAYLLAGH